MRSAASFTSLRSCGSMSVNHTAESNLSAKHSDVAMACLIDGAQLRLALRLRQRLHARCGEQQPRAALRER